MKWSLKIIIVLTIGIQSAGAQIIPKVPADLQKYFAEMQSIKNAHITERYEWKYILHDGNVTNTRYCTRIIKYDEIGRMSESIALDQKGQKMSILIFSYDKHNMPETETEYLPTGEILGRTVYDYTPGQYLQNITWYHGTEYIIDKTVFETDEQSQTLTERHLYSPDSVDSKVIYYYSDLQDGWVEKERMFSGEDGLEYEKEIIRNDNRKIESEEWLNGAGTHIYSLKYHYNSEGNLVLQDKLFATGQRIKVADFNYSPASLLTGEINYNAQGEISRYRKFSYK